MTASMVLAGLAVGAATLLLGRPRASPPCPAGFGRIRLTIPVLAVGAVGLAVASPARLPVGVPAGLLLVTAGVLLAGRALLRLRRRRAEAARTAERVLEVCELLASELVAGLAPEVALRRAAQAWPTLGPVAEAAELGSDPAAALHDMAVAPGAGDLRLVAAAWTVAHRTGAGLADALDRVAGAIRDRRATSRVVESELASARATARLVAALPVVMLLLGGGEGSGAWTFLLGSPAGLACLAGGAGLGLAGLWWIERIADGVQR